MARTAILAIRIISDARNAAKDLQAYEGKVGRTQKALSRVSGPAKAVAAGIAGIGVAVAKQASDAQQAAGAVESVYGKQAARVKGLAKQAANSVGLAASDYNQLAAVLGAQLGNLGVSQGKLVGTTDSLIKQGADMAAMFGGTTADAVDALSAAFRGETDPIEKYGVSIKQAAVQAELARRGQDKLKGKALQAAKTQATLALITRQTAKAHGQFARESNSAAGAQQIATANAKNAAAALGTALLPAVSAVAGKAAALASFVTQNHTAFLILLGVLGAVAVTILAVNAAVSAYQTAMKIATAAQWLWNAAMDANPATLITLAIIAVIAAVVILYKRSKTFQGIVQGAFRAAAAAAGWVVSAVRNVIKWVGSNATAAWKRLQAVALAVWRIVTAPSRVLITAVASVITWVATRAPSAFRRLQSVARSVWSLITSPARSFGDVVRWIIDKVSALINAIRHIHFPSPPKWVSGLFGGGGGGLFGSAPGGGLTASSLTAASSGGLSTPGNMRGGGMVNIYVQGALDPDAVARQIEQILGRRARRIGGRP